MNDIKNKQEKCYKKIWRTKNPCSESECRHFLKSEQGLNCSIIVANEGPKTLQEIGDYYGVSRMRICQIEKMILKKLRKNSNNFEPHDPSSG